MWELDGLGVFSVPSECGKALAPNSTSSVNYGTVHYSEVFNEGYSSMETSYECVFDGKDIAQKCGDGARVCTDYIKLPKSLHPSPPMTEDTPLVVDGLGKKLFRRRSTRCTNR